MKLKKIDLVFIWLCLISAVLLISFVAFTVSAGTISQPFGTAVSDTIGGGQYMVQKIFADETGTIERIIVYPDPTVVTMCDFHNGGTMGIYIYNTALNSQVGDYRSPPDTPNTGNGCIYDRSSGSGSITDGTEYRLVSFQPNTKWYGITSGADDNFGYTNGSFTSQTFGTVGLSDAKYYVSTNPAFVPVEDTTTRIIDFQPEAGTTTATTTVNFNVDYYFNDTEFENPLGWQMCVDTINLEVGGINTVSGATNQFSACGDITASGSGNFSTTTLLLAGTHQTTLYFKNASSSEIYSSQSYRFIVLQSNIPNNWLTTGTTTDPFTECPTLDESAGGWLACRIGQVIQSVLAFLFLPSDASFQAFRNLTTTLSQKPPFGYFSLIETQIDLITATSSPTFTVQSTDTINSMVFDPIRTGLGYLIWFGWGVFMYKRLSKITI